MLPELFAILDLIRYHLEHGILWWVKVRSEFKPAGAKPSSPSIEMRIDWIWLIKMYHRDGYIDFVVLERNTEDYRITFELADPDMLESMERIISARILQYIGGKRISWLRGATQII